MPLNLAPTRTPLVQDAHGAVRIGGTRVPLETVIAEFLQGATAEQIAQSFDALRLEDVYATITYYLQNRREVDEYLRQRNALGGETEDDGRRRVDHAGLRARLLARRQSKG
jgi:uncharacterized protein (DUF433 family)